MWGRGTQEDIFGSTQFALLPEQKFLLPVPTRVSRSRAVRGTYLVAFGSVPKVLRLKTTLRSNSRVMNCNESRGHRVYLFARSIIHGMRHPRSTGPLAYRDSDSVREVDKRASGSSEENSEIGDKKIGCGAGI